MKFFRTLRRSVCLTAAFLLLAGSCLAEEIRTEEKGLDLTEEVHIRYPVVTGMEDTALSEQINERILEDCRIREYLARAAQLISGGKLEVGWTGGVAGDVFSCAVPASGAVEGPRNTFVWTWSSIDLRDGEEITFRDLFTDTEAARQCMEEYLEEAVAPELSAHLLNNELLPLPEGFFLESTGLTLLWPVNQLSTLSDRAGDIRIPWSVLRPLLLTGEDSILRRIGAEEMITLSEESGTKLRAMATEGKLPGIPAALGDRMLELTDRYHMLTDPDGFEDGRLFSLEGGCFRGVYLMTDDLDRGWENSTVQGIRTDLGCIWGLCIGETTRPEWISALGEPEYTAEVGEEKAEANRIVPGRCDYYSCGNHQLRLYSDEHEVLVSVVLTE